MVLSLPSSNDKVCLHLLALDSYLKFKKSGTKAILMMFRYCIWSRQNMFYVATRIYAYIWTMVVSSGLFVVMDPLDHVHMDKQRKIETTIDRSIFVWF